MHEAQITLDEKSSLAKRVLPWGQQLTHFYRIMKTVMLTLIKPQGRKVVATSAADVLFLSASLINKLQLEFDYIEHFKPKACKSDFAL
jgi:hypothetical protein